MVSTEIPILPTETQELVGNSLMDATVTQEHVGTKRESSRRRRTRDSWVVERERIEITILKPRVPTETQEPLGNLPMVNIATQEPMQTQLEIL